MNPFLQRKVSVLVVVVLLLAVSSTSFAALQGDPLKLGLTNTINFITTLSGSVPNSMFNVTNTNTATDASVIQATNTGGGPALNLRVRAGRAPMKVNSIGKVLSLNADLLDNLDSAALQRRVAGVCAAGSSIRAIDATGAVVCEADDNSGGDITGVTAGSGLTGGGTSGALTLSANFPPAGGSNGTATTVARADHNHDSRYLALTGTAADANLLDGKDSTAFIQGSGQALHGAAAFPPDTEFIILTTTSPDLSLTYFCPSSLTSAGEVTLANGGAEVMNVFIDSGAANPFYGQLTPGSHT